MQRALSAVRFSPLLHVGIALAATALMFLSSAAALCSCVLCFQTVAVFWADAGGGGGGRRGTTSPLHHSSIPTADVVLPTTAAMRERSAGGSDGGSEGETEKSGQRSGDRTQHDEVHSVASGAPLAATHAAPVQCNASTCACRAQGAQQQCARPSSGHIELRRHLPS